MLAWSLFFFGDFTSLKGTGLSDYTRLYGSDCNIISMTSHIFDGAEKPAKSYFLFVNISVTSFTLPGNWMTDKVNETPTLSPPLLSV